MRGRRGFVFIDAATMAAVLAMRGATAVEVVEIEPPRPPRLDGIREALQPAADPAPSRGPAVRRKWPIRR